MHARKGEGPTPSFSVIPAKAGIHLRTTGSIEERSRFEEDHEKKNLIRGQPVLNWTLTGSQSAVIYRVKSLSREVPHGD